MVPQATQQAGSATPETRLRHAVAHQHTGLVTGEWHSTAGGPLATPRERLGMGALRRISTPHCTQRVVQHATTGKRGTETEKLLLAFLFQISFFSCQSIKGAVVAAAGVGPSLRLLLTKTGMRPPAPSCMRSSAELVCSAVQQAGTSRPAACRGLRTCSRSAEP